MFDRLIAKTVKAVATYYLISVGSDVLLDVIDKKLEDRKTNRDQTK